MKILPLWEKKSSGDWLPVLSTLHLNYDLFFSVSLIYLYHIGIAQLLAIRRGGVTGVHLDLGCHSDKCVALQCYFGLSRQVSLIQNSGPELLSEQVYTPCLIF